MDIQLRILTKQYSLTDDWRRRWASAHRRDHAGEVQNHCLLIFGASKGTGDCKYISMPKRSIKIKKNVLCGAIITTATGGLCKAVESMSELPR